jgi:dolichyl-phosphate-mannose-protein mannosyltransferase
MEAPAEVSASPPPERARGLLVRAVMTAAATPGALALIALPVAKLLVHLSVGPGYGYHRDELYGLACADHLDWGYVDHPPFAIVVLAATRGLLGDSVAAIRVIPAMLGALTVLLVGIIARRLGGGPFAQALAMTAALIAPFYLALDHYFSMNAFDLLLWGLTAYLLLRILQGGSPRLWLLMGILLGIGLENKISVLWLGAGLFVGLLLTPQRVVLRTRWPWLAAGIVICLFLPHVVWQARHGWPTVEFARNAMARKLVAMPPQAFLRAQLEGMLFLAAPVWAAGIVFYLFLRGGRGLRALGWAFLAVFAFLALSGGSRAAYLAPAYTWLLPAGGVAIEGGLARVGSWVRAGILVVLGAVGLLTSPVVLPVLPEKTLAAVVQRRNNRRLEERFGVGPLPEFLSHMCGWDEIIETLVSVHRQLPKEEREGARILAPNYGVAAAIDIIGRRQGLPAAVSGHNSYWLWGPPTPPANVMIVVGRTEADLREWFAEVTLAAHTRCEYCMPYENDQPVWVVRGPRIPLETLWPRLKIFM